MFEYGITSSRADVWIHVCPKDYGFYLYNRQAMVDRLDRFREVSIPTARGRLVPILENMTESGGILRYVAWRSEAFDLYPWQDVKTDAAAGDYGEQITMDAINSGVLRFPSRALMVTGKQGQFQGVDLMVYPVRDPIRAEVKTEINGGIYGTGNLFIQTHECHDRLVRHVRDNRL